MAPEIITAVRNRPLFMVLHGQEGVGKTSFGAFAPDPVFIQVGNETGLETLVAANRLPKTSHFKQACQTWDELLEDVTWLLQKKHDHTTLVIDTLNGAERLCYDHVIKENYGGKAGDDGFLSYQQGYTVALGPWRRLLKGLDMLRTERNMLIICLCHTAKRTFKNPEGPDYDRYEPAFEGAKAWGQTLKDADIVLFMSFHTEVRKEGAAKPGRATPKGKASGGQSRVIYTEHSATYDAKNRHGLPIEIDADGGGSQAWDNFATALTEARGSKED